MADIVQQFTNLQNQVVWTLFSDGTVTGVGAASKFSAISISGNGTLPPFGDGSSTPFAISTPTDDPYQIMLHVQTRPATEFGFLWQTNAAKLQIGASDSTLYHIIEFDIVNHTINIAPNGSGRRIILNAQTKVVSMPVFANNAAAIAGGLIVGDLYRTGADPDHVCIVH